MRRREGLSEEDELIAGARPRPGGRRGARARRRPARRSARRLHRGALHRERPRLHRRPRRRPEDRLLLRPAAEPPARGAARRRCRRARPLRPQRRVHGSTRCAAARASVVAVESAARLIERARRHLADNGLDAARVSWVEGNVFEELRRLERRFDLVVCDPPPLVRAPRRPRRRRARLQGPQPPGADAPRRRAASCSPSAAAAPSTPSSSARSSSPPRSSRGVGWSCSIRSPPPPTIRSASPTSRASTSRAGWWRRGSEQRTAQPAARRAATPRPNTRAQSSIASSWPSTTWIAICV